MNRWRTRVSLIALLTGVACGAWGGSSSSPLPDAANPEFGGQCLLGLAEGQHVQTDCSTNWIGPDGKTYCFSDAAAKKKFLEDPKVNLEKARDFVAVSDMKATDEAMDRFRSQDVEDFATRLIQEAAAKNGGKYPFEDALTGEKLNLAFDDIEFVRTIHGYGFFPDMAFHDPEDPQKKYLIDFWIMPRQGKLSLMESRIYSAPQREGKTWKTMERIPPPWWWIPASEHPGQLEQTRSWQVMSAIEQDVADQSHADGGVFQIKDDKTGETLKLKFVDSHQPVRRLSADGRYFACTDFVAADDKDKYYDLDFWLTQKDGKMTVDQVRVHKVPVKQADGHWVEIPRYNLDELKTEDVP